MAYWSADCRAVKSVVRLLFELAWVVNDFYHHEQGRGENDCVRVLGNLKVLLLAVAHTLIPEAFKIRPTDDFACGTYWAVELLERGYRPLHVPKAKWAEAKSNPLLKNWFTL